MLRRLCVMTITVGLFGTLSQVLAPTTAVAAGGTVVFQNSFSNRTVDGTGTITVPATPTGTNGACLTASGNTSTGPIYSCAGNVDVQGSGKLRFTGAANHQVGGMFGSTSIPTTHGIDLTFNSYQWGGSGGDGLSFTLTAADPVNPAPPTVTGHFGGSLGYSPYPGNGSNRPPDGLAHGYLGIGFDVYGNFSATPYSGSGCTNPPNFGSVVPNAVAVRGPGNGRVGYCPLTTTYNGTTASMVAMHASTRAAAKVPVQILINPTTGPFTSDSGVTVAANSYVVVVTGIGQQPRRLTGTLPAVPAGLYPSTSWLNANGVPKQLVMGLFSSTGAYTDVHEISDVRAKTFEAVPRLGVSTTSYAAATSQPGDPVNYKVSATVLKGVDEPGKVSLTQTVPTGVVPVGAFGTGWECARAVGRVITCTTTTAGFASGTALPVLNVVGIVTAAGVTASTVASSSLSRVSSPTGVSATDTTATTSTRPPGPANVVVSPSTGPVTGGGPVTISGTNLTGPATEVTAVEIGTADEQQTGNPVVLLPCPGAPASGCFSVSGDKLVISSMPARTSAVPVSVTVVTLGIAGAAGYVYADRPATPAAPTATAGISRATVSWSAPATNGSPITGYRLTRYLNGTSEGTTSYGATTSTTVTGLTPGGSYTFTVAAVNAYGTSDPSGPSTAAVPYALPDAPSVTALSAGTGSAVMSWTTPNGNGRPVTGYVVVPYVGSTAMAAQTFPGSATTRTVTGLTAGTAYTFTVAAQNVAGTGPASARSASVTPNRSPSITPSTPPSGEVGVPYHHQFGVTDGTAPHTWSVSAGSLPPGLTLDASTGLLSGTPGTAGTYSFTVRVLDASGQAATLAVTTTIAAAPGVTFTPPAGEVAVAYTAQPALTGGTGPFTWSVTSGSLPPGLSFSSSTGAITGTPATAGSFPLTIRVTDSFARTASAAATLTIVPQPAFTGATPPDGQVAVAYGHTMAVTGGAQPLSWSVTAGSLPPGLALNTATGALSGTPTTSGGYSFTVTVTDANGQTATRTATVEIAAGPLVITTSASGSSAAPGATVAYTITVENTGASAFAGVALTNSLQGVLDDATYNGNATATSGTLSYSAPTLRWTGNLAPGASVTIGYSVTVATTGGDRVLTGTVTSPTLGTNCAAGSDDARCAVAVTVPGLAIARSAGTGSTIPGNTVRLTTVITNSGRTPFPSVAVADSLAGVLDDATYNADATATTGSVSYNRPSLTWTGALAPGASATISYTVTVANPPAGDRVITATATSSAPGSACPATGSAAACTVAVNVLVPMLSITNSANSSAVTPGDTVAYTTTLVNTGETAYTGASVTVALAGALDDATYDGNATATAGSVVYDAGSSRLTWTGNLAVGTTVVITTSLTVRSPAGGDRTLTTLATSAEPGSTCRPAAPQPSCATTVQVRVPALTVAATTDVSTASPGDVVVYTVTATNSGQTAYTGASLGAALGGLLDDATYNSDLAATRGSASIAGGRLSWTGDLAIGASATITYSVTVRDPPTGDRTLGLTVASPTAGSNCRSGSTGPSCTTTVRVLVPGLAIGMTTGVTTTTPGSVLRYTLTVTNTGETTYVDLPVTVDVDSLVDDADYNFDASVSAGKLVIRPDGTVGWIGSIAPGTTVTGSMSFTVRPARAGDRIMAAVLTADVPGSNCRTGSTDPGCRTSVTVLVPGLTITKTAATTTAAPGDTVGYTISVTNDGETDQPSAAFADDLARVLSDAVYAEDATATTGAVSYDGTVLRWTGPLARGESVTVTYSVTVRDPDPGDKTMVNTVVSQAPGNNCPSGGTDPRCTATVRVLVPALTLAQVADAATTVPGATVGFTVTATNSGTAALPAARFDVDLAGLLDDAVDNGGATAGTGTVSISGSTLTWTGELAVGAATTVRYSATVRAEDAGDDLVGTTLTSRTPGSGNCATGGTDTRCATVVPVARLVMEVATSEGTVTPGSALRMTATFTNTGRVPYTGITVHNPRADTSDDAYPNGDQTATAGSLSLTPSSIMWTGSIPVGGSVVATGTMTVRDPATGNRVITATMTTTAPGANCAPGGTDPRCTSRAVVVEPVLVLGTSASATSVDPGGTVDYTTTVANPGPVAYSSASAIISLAGVLGKATYNGDAVTTLGSLTPSPTALTWTGPLAIGETATITYSVTAETAPGADKALVTSVSSTTAGSTCPPSGGGGACRGTVLILTPALTIVQTAGLSTATLGATVGYSIRVTNSGQTTYPAATLSAELAGLLDDATYTGDATATAGTVGVSDDVLSWSGALAPGAAATVTYSVTVDNPAAGDGRMVTAITSSTPGANCLSGGTDTRCTSNTPIVNSVSLTFTKTADVAAAAAGDRIVFTVTATNASEVDEDVEFTDPLADILDDATYGGDASATAGSPTVADDELTWSGTVPAYGTVTVSYSVTVDDVPGGNSTLSGTVTSASIPSSNNCGPTTPDARCTATVRVAALVVEQRYDAASTTPGSVVRLTVTLTNTGQMPYEGITVTSSLADVLDEATPNGDQTASSGVLGMTATAVTWTGDIAVGEVVTITGTLTVHDAVTGDRELVGVTVTDTLGANCRPGGTDPRCTASLPVLLPGLTITKSADATAVAPRVPVTHTITIANTGETSYTDIAVTDSMAGVLDDATYGGDATATAGALSFDSPALTWTGDLPVGATATVTYSVTPGTTGDKIMVDTVSSPAAGSSCPVAGTGQACRTTVAVLTPALAITSATSSATTAPGATVGYTVTATNVGQTPYDQATLEVALDDVLDDATYGGDATATTGAVRVSDGTLTWTGDLGHLATVRISYSVVVDATVAGNFRLAQTVVSGELGSTCLDGAGDSRCTTSVPVAGLRIVNSADTASATPGSVVRTTITATNIGQVSYVDAEVSLDMAGALDEAAYNGDARAGSGSVTLSTSSETLTWTGDLAVGETVVITVSLTVNLPPFVDKRVTAVVTTAAAGSNCPAATPDAVCRTSVGVLTPDLAVHTVADARAVTPGSTVGYMTTITNTGEAPFTSVTVTDALNGLLDDATYGGDAAATSGTVDLTGAVMTWVGDVAIGETVTVTYHVRVNDPDLGDRVLVNAVRSHVLGSSCPPEGPGPSCRAFVTVLVPALDISVTADRTTAAPGDDVGYTVSLTNTGDVPYDDAVVTTDLAGVLDDATYNGDAAATAGTVTATGEHLVWTGDLAVGATVVVTHTAAVSDPAGGNRLLTTSVTSSAQGSTCGTAPPCVNSVAVLVPGLEVSASASLAVATPGDEVTVTVKISNTGESGYTGISVTTDLARALDDADLTGTATATRGSVTTSAQVATWSGDLPVGATALVRFSVTVRSTGLGDRTLSATVTAPAPGSSCRDSAANPDCTATAAVLVPRLDITTSASTPATLAGGTVDYTVTVTNTGETYYSGVTVTNTLADALTDSHYNADAEVVVGSGVLAFDGAAITWTGDLPVGASATFTYSVTVHDPYSGDHLMISTVTSDAPGSGCRPGSGCSVAVRVLRPTVEISMAADTTAATAGGTARFTVTVANTGEVPDQQVSFANPLADVLDDAAYGEDAVASAGMLTYAGGTIGWSGVLDVGEAATVTYAVAVNDPATGDRTMNNRVMSASAGATCATGSGPGCAVTVPVLVPALDITKTADATEAAAGDTVTYTVTAANSGEAAYPGVALTDSLAAVLDDASYNADATATTGTVSYWDGMVRWTGHLPVGAMVRLTYSVTVRSDASGDGVMTNRIVSGAQGSTCFDGSTDQRCAATTTTTRTAGPPSGPPRNPSGQPWNPSGQTKNPSGQPWKPSGPTTNPRTGAGEEATMIGLTELTPSFTLSGPTDSVVTAEGAVTMRVTTNNPNGYVVSVRAVDTVLAVGTPDNDTTIPVGRVSVRERGTSQFHRLSATVPVAVHRQNTPSAPDGDVLGNDYRIDIPFVPSDRYSATLEYVVGVQ
ncbi:hypothetical protein BU204_23260 [Actinophytocola xanthii]|uniref:Fibronectin type-III domain-containing protein n=1 Tax=Actinophytocola xanthii TaxID=1912961 RepID=A0A1Q8CLG3_9PSEU|nr:hypothetical protein BU204_23260 [Actinophytocola xanthii]